MSLWTLAVAGALAATPVTLPRGQDADAWAESLALADLEVGVPRGTAWVILAETTDGTWWLVVRRVDGSVERVGVEPVRTASDREAVAFLAASLLEPVAPVAVVTPVVPPRPALPSPPPSPSPPAAPAVPALPPEPAPAVPAPAPIEPRGWWGLSAGLGGQVGGGAAGTTVVTGGLDLATARRRGVALQVARPASAELTATPGVQDVQRLDLVVSGLLDHPRGLRVLGGVGGSRRRVDETGGATSRGWVPLARVDGQWLAELDGRATLSVGAWVGVDLTDTVLVRPGLEPEALPRVAAGLGVALRHGRALRGARW